MSCLFLNTHKWLTLAPGGDHIPQAGRQFSVGVCTLPRPFILAGMIPESCSFWETPSHSLCTSEHPVWFHAFHSSFAPEITTWRSRWHGQDMALIELCTQETLEAAGRVWKWGVEFCCMCHEYKCVFFNQCMQRKNLINGSKNKMHILSVVFQTLPF